LPARCGVTSLTSMNGFAVTEDPNGDVARARMALVYGQDTADAFFALLDNIVVRDVPYTHGSASLEPAITSVDLNLSYDDFRHRLSHTGLLSEATRNALKTIHGVTAAFQNAVDDLFARSEDVSGSFFNRYQELKPLYDNVLTLDHTLVLNANYTQTAATLDPAIIAADPGIAYDSINHRLSYSGILTAARRDALKSVAGVTAQFQAAVDALFARSQEAKGMVLAALQPELARRRKRQQALDRLSAAASVDISFAQTLLDPETPPPTRCTPPGRSASPHSTT
jgi:hypothetical protein